MAEKTTTTTKEKSKKKAGGKLKLSRWAGTRFAQEMFVWLKRGAYEVTVVMEDGKVITIRKPEIQIVGYDLPDATPAEKPDHDLPDATPTEKPDLT